MDKSWIEQDYIHGKIEFIEGVENFLQFAYSTRPGNSDILCPCINCQNRRSYNRKIVKNHCLQQGFMTTYTNGIYHGEQFTPRRDIHMDEPTEGTNLQDIELYPLDDMIRMAHEVTGIAGSNDSMRQEKEAGNNMEGIDDDTARLLKLLEDASCEFRPVCQKYTKLSVIIRMLQLKVMHGMSNKSLDGWLEFLKDVFPEAKFPKSYYEANKITTSLGFACKTWDVCPKNCMIFKDEDEKLEKCDVCKTPRYLEKGNHVPAKRMRYFPLRPRLQKLYTCSKTASLMKWHAESRTYDGTLRHPAYCEAWKDFDNMHPHFSFDPRNVRLGLATDGFNPFHNMLLAHSIWPIVLIPYNLPPWLCMRQSFFILSTIIDGPRSPGDKIYVYLQPLIEELKELWVEGVHTYDSHEKEMFTLKASIMWTISDFPGYGMLSEYNVYVPKKCPRCGIGTRSFKLSKNQKSCFGCHRVFLPMNHRFRKDKESFYHKEIELRKPQSLPNITDQLEVILTVYKKTDLKRRNQRNFDKEKHKLWKKRSIFYELPYWSTNMIQHNLDGMHIVKKNSDKCFMDNIGLSHEIKR